MTIEAEKFRTNIRATVATTVPEFVRGHYFLGYTSFNIAEVYLMVSLVSAGIVVRATVLILALWGIFGIKESFANDLDYTENL